jgi:4-hydroxyproline epimerase
MANPVPTGSETRRVRVIDSPTEGEPTRVVVSDGPDLGSGPLSERRERFRDQHDAPRQALVSEPRGSEVIVGAWLRAPEDPRAAAGTIFFNNAGYLGMCGHGTIGLVATLCHPGRVGPGPHAIETPVGTVKTVLEPSGRVTVRNVTSDRHRARVPVTVPGHGTGVGDVAYGGNGFFLTDTAPTTLALVHPRALTEFALVVRDALDRDGVTGAGGAPIDHFELSGPPAHPRNDSRNFVLCPGGLYDRSPSGTGTSAKLPCLLADGRLRPGGTRRQEGILGTVFEGSAVPDGAGVRPSISGRAHVVADTELFFDPDDPFREGIAP